MAKKPLTYDDYEEALEEFGSAEEAISSLESEGFNLTTAWKGKIKTAFERKEFESPEPEEPDEEPAEEPAEEPTHPERKLKELKGDEPIDLGTFDPKDIILKGSDVQNILDEAEVISPAEARGAARGYGQQYASNADIQQAYHRYIGELTDQHMKDPRIKEKLAGMEQEQINDYREESHSAYYAGHLALLGAEQGAIEKLSEKVWDYPFIRSLYLEGSEESYREMWKILKAQGKHSALKISVARGLTTTAKLAKGREWELDPGTGKPDLDETTMSQEARRALIGLEGKTWDEQIAGVADLEEYEKPKALRILSKQADEAYRKEMEADLVPENRIKARLEEAKQDREDDAGDYFQKLMLLEDPAYAKEQGKAQSFDELSRGITDPDQKKRYENLVREYKKQDRMAVEKSQRVVAYLDQHVQEDGTWAAEVWDDPEYQSRIKEINSHINGANQTRALMNIPLNRKTESWLGAAIDLAFETGSWVLEHTKSGTDLYAQPEATVGGFSLDRFDPPEGETRGSRALKDILSQSYGWLDRTAVSMAPVLQKDVGKPEELIAKEELDPSFFKAEDWTKLSKPEETSVRVQMAASQLQAYEIELTELAERMAKVSATDPEQLDKLEQRHSILKKKHAILDEAMEQWGTAKGLPDTLGEILTYGFGQPAWTETVPASRSLTGLRTSIGQLAYDLEGATGLDTTVMRSWEAEDLRENYPELSQEEAEDMLSQIRKDLAKEGSLLKALGSATDRNVTEFFDPHVQQIIEAEDIDDLIAPDSQLAFIQYGRLPPYLTHKIMLPTGLTKKEARVMPLLDIFMLARKQGEVDPLTLADFKRTVEQREDAKKRNSVTTEALNVLVGVGFDSEFDDHTGTAKMQMTWQGKVLFHWAPLAEEAWAEIPFAVTFADLVNAVGNMAYSGVVSQLPGGDVLPALYSPKLTDLITSWEPSVTDFFGMEDTPISSFLYHTLPSGEQLSLPIPILSTPAGIDSLWKQEAPSGYVGLRSSTSSWLDRVVASSQVGMGGFMEGYEDLAVMAGYDEADWEYSVASWLGLGAGFVIPYETVPVKAMSGGVATISRSAEGYKLGASRGAAWQTSAIFAANTGGEYMPIMSVMMAQNLTDNLNKRARLGEGGYLLLEEDPSLPFDTLTGYKDVTQASLAGDMRYFFNRHDIEMGRNPIRDLQQRAARADEELSGVAGHFIEKDAKRAQSQLDQQDQLLRRFGTNNEEMKVAIDLELFRTVPQKLELAEEFLRKGTPDVQKMKKSAEWWELMDLLEEAVEKGLISKDSKGVYPGFYTSLAMMAEDGPLNFLKDLNITIRQQMGEGSQKARVNLYHKVAKVSESILSELEVDKPIKGSSFNKQINETLSEQEASDYRKKGLAFDKTKEYTAKEFAEHIRYRQESQLTSVNRDYRYEVEPGALTAQTELTKKVPKNAEVLEFRVDVEGLSREARVWFTRGRGKKTFIIRHIEVDWKPIEVDPLSPLFQPPTSIKELDLELRSALLDRVMGWALDEGFSSMIIQTNALYGDLKKEYQSPTEMLKRINRYLRQWGAKLTNTPKHFTLKGKTVFFPEAMLRDASEVRRAKAETPLRFEAEKVSADLPFHPDISAAEQVEFRRQNLEEMANRYRAGYMTREDATRQKNSLPSTSESHKLVQYINEQVEKGEPYKISPETLANIKERVSKELEQAQIKLKAQGPLRYGILTEELVLLLSSLEGLDAKNGVRGRAPYARFKKAKENFEQRAHKEPRKQRGELQRIIDGQNYVDALGGQIDELSSELSAKIRSEIDSKEFEGTEGLREQALAEAEIRQTQRDEAVARAIEERAEKIIEQFGYDVAQNIDVFDVVGEEIRLPKTLKELHAFMADAAGVVPGVEAILSYKTDVQLIDSETGGLRAVESLVQEIAERPKPEDDTVNVYRTTNPTELVYQVNVAGQQEIKARSLVHQPSDGEPVSILAIESTDISDGRAENMSLLRLRYEANKRWFRANPDEANKGIAKQMLADLRRINAVESAAFSDNQSPARRAVRAFIKQLSETKAQSVGWRLDQSAIGEAIIEEYRMQGMEMPLQTALVDGHTYIYVDLTGPAKREFLNMPEQAKGETLSFFDPLLRGADSIEYSQLADRIMQMDEEGMPPVSSAEELYARLPKEERAAAESLGRWLGIDRLLSIEHPQRKGKITMSQLTEYLEVFNTQVSHNIESRFYGYTPTQLRGLKSSLENQIRAEERAKENFVGDRHRSQRAVYDNNISSLNELLQNINSIVETTNLRESRWYEKDWQMVSAGGESRLVSLTIPIDPTQRNLFPGQAEYLPSEAALPDPASRSVPPHNELFAEPNVVVEARLTKYRLEGKTYLLVEDMGLKGSHSAADGPQLTSGVWSDVAVRRIVHMAAQEGFDGVGIINFQTAATIDWNRFAYPNALLSLSKDWDVPIHSLHGKVRENSDEVSVFNAIEISSDMRNSVTTARGAPLFADAAPSVRTVSFVDEMDRRYGSKRFMDRFSGEEQVASLGLAEAGVYEDFDKVLFGPGGIALEPNMEKGRCRVRIGKDRYLKISDIKKFKEKSFEEYLKDRSEGIPDDEFLTIPTARNMAMEYMEQEGLGWFKDVGAAKMDTGPMQVGVLFRGMGRNDVINRLRYEVADHMAVYTQEDGKQKLAMRQVAQRKTRESVATMHLTERTLYQLSQLDSAEIVINSKRGVINQSDILWMGIAAGAKKLTIVTPRKTFSFTLPTLIAGQRKRMLVDPEEGQARFSFTSEVEQLREALADAVNSVMNGDKSLSEAEAVGLQNKGDGAYVDKVNNLLYSELQDVLTDFGEPTQDRGKILRKKTLTKREERHAKDKRLRTGDLISDYQSTKKYTEAVDVSIRSGDWLEQFKFGLIEKELSYRKTSQRLRARDIWDEARASIVNLDEMMAFLDPGKTHNLPEYINNMVTHLRKLKEKWIKKDYKPSDVAKAFCITVSSMQAQGKDLGAFLNTLLDHEKAQNYEYKIFPIDTIEMMTGMRFTSFEGTVRMIRPEDAAAAWLMSERGQYALSELDAGRFATEWHDINIIRRAFGSKSMFDTASTFNDPAAFVRNMQEVAGKIRKLEKVGDIVDAVTSLSGIADQKHPFMMQFLGFGMKATVDAQEINAWFSLARIKKGLEKPKFDLPAKIKSVLGQRPSGEVDRLSRLISDLVNERITEMRKQFPMTFKGVEEDLSSSIIHQWIWTKMKGFESEQPQLFKTMLSGGEYKIEDKQINHLSSQAKHGSVGATLAGNFLLKTDPDLWINTTAVEHVLAVILNPQMVGPGQAAKFQHAWATIKGRIKDKKVLADIALRIQNAQSQTMPVKFRGTIIDPKEQTKELIQGGLYYTGKEDQKLGVFRNKAGLYDISVASAARGTKAFFHEHGHLLEALLSRDQYESMVKNYDNRMKGGRRELTRRGREDFADDFVWFMENRDSMHKTQGMPGDKLQVFQNLFPKVTEWYFNSRASTDSIGWLPRSAMREWDAIFRPAREAWLKATLAQKDMLGEGLRPTITIGESSYIAATIKEPKSGLLREDEPGVGLAARKVSMKISRVPTAELLNDLRPELYGSKIDAGKKFEVGATVDAVDLWARSDAWLYTNAMQEFSAFRTAKYVTKTLRTIVPEPISQLMDDNWRKKVKRATGLTSDALKKKLKSEEIRTSDVAPKTPGRKRIVELVLTEKEMMGMDSIVEEIRGYPMGSHLGDANTLFRPLPDGNYAIDLLDWNKIRDGYMDSMAPLGARRSRAAEAINPNILSAISNGFLKWVSDKLDEKKWTKNMKKLMNELSNAFIPRAPGEQSVSPTVSEFWAGKIRQLNEIPILMNRAADDRGRWVKVVSPVNPTVKTMTRRMRRVLIPPVETTHLQILQNLVLRIRGAKSMAQNALFSDWFSDLKKTQSVHDKSQNSAFVQKVTKVIKSLGREIELAAQPHLAVLRKYKEAIEQDSISPALEKNFRKSRDVLMGLMKEHMGEPMSIADMAANKGLMFNQMTEVMRQGKGMNVKQADSVDWVRENVINPLIKDPELKFETEFLEDASFHIHNMYIAIERKHDEVSMRADDIMRSLLGNLDELSETAAVRQRERFLAYTLFYDGKWHRADMDLAQLLSDERTYHPNNPPNGVQWRQTDVIEVARDNGLIDPMTDQDEGIKAIQDLIDSISGTVPGLRDVEFRKVADGDNQTLSLIAREIRTNKVSLGTARTLAELGDRLGGAPGARERNFLNIKTSDISQMLEMTARMMAYDVMHETAQELADLGLFGKLREVASEDLYKIGHNPIEMGDYYTDRVEFHISQHLNLKMNQIERPLDSGGTLKLQDMRKLLSDPLEQSAYNRAMEIINTYGMSQRGSLMLDKMVQHKFPDGSTALIPEPISVAMTDAFDRVVPVGLEVGGLKPKNLTMIFKGRKLERELRLSVESNIYRKTELAEKLIRETGETPETVKLAMLAADEQVSVLWGVAKWWGAVGAGMAVGAAGTAALGAGILPGLAAGGLFTAAFGATPYISPQIRAIMDTNEAKAKPLQARAKALEEEYYKEWYAESIKEGAAKRKLSLKEYMEERMEEQPSQAALSGRQISDVMSEILLKYPRLNGLIKTGVTVGLYLPTQAYYLGNLLGGIVQVYMRHGLWDGSKLLGDSIGMAKFNTSVISMVHGEGYRNNSPKTVIITKDMRIYTTDMVADMITTYGVGSSFIKAETSRSLSEDFYRKNRTGWSKLLHEFGGETLNLALVEFAESMDNIYRVGMFTSYLKRGYSPDEAAALVRETMFDYANLTDFERDICRQIFLFYSFMRKNTALVWWTLMNEPSRLMAQLRLTGDLAEQAVEDDPEIVIGEFYNSRMIVPGSLRTFKNKKGQRLFGDTHQGRVYVTPAMNGADGVAMFGSLYGLASLSNPEAWQTMLGSMVPLVQSVAVLGLGVLPFRGMDIKRVKIAPELIEMDKVLGGPVFSKGPHQVGYIDIDFETEQDPMKMKGGGQYIWRPRTQEDAKKWYLIHNIGQGLPVVGPFVGRSTPQTQWYIQAAQEAGLLEGQGIDEAIGQDYYDWMARGAGFKAIPVYEQEYALQQARLNMLREINRGSRDTKRD